MSKKNRHKSRPPQRPVASAQPPAAPVVADRAAGASVADDASTDVVIQDADVAQADSGLETRSDATPTLEIDASAADAVAVHAVDRARDAQAAGASQDAAETPAPLAFAPPTPAPMASAGDIRGVLIQVAGARLLMPNATIAEVLSYADPEPVGESAPAWLLGRLRWRGWQVPLVAFGTLAGVAEERAALGSKVVVLKALAGTSRTPYFAMLTQGFPRLVTVSRHALSVEDDTAEAMPRGVQARVRLNEDPALLPDLEALEALVADAVAQAA